MEIPENASPIQPPVAASAAAAMVVPTPAATTSTIQYDDFAKIELRIGTIVEAKAAPKGDRLLVLQVDLGSERRQILAGIRQHYQPEQLIGKQIVVVANLCPEP